MSQHRQNHGRSLSVATAALFATFLLIATAASAASDTTRPYSGTTTNYCNGDSVAFSGQEHIVSNIHVGKDSTVMNFLDQVNGSGAGTPSTLQYTVGLTSKVNGKFPPGPTIFQSRTKVISNGPADNYFETFFFRFNQDGTIGTTSFTSDCRG